jgi:hypothetical protein
MTEPQQPEPTPESTPGSTWSPLKNRLFAILLLINLSATLAIFMNGLASAWVLTDITNSPAW